MTSRHSAGAARVLGLIEDLELMYRGIYFGFYDDTIASLSDHKLGILTRHMRALLYRIDRELKRRRKRAEPSKQRRAHHGE